MNVLVVTGGIGSGKSEVCRILATKGLTDQYNADARVKELYVSSPGLLDSIEKRIHCKVRDNSGRLVPALLAERIFADRAALEAVEAVVFPALMEDFRSFVSAASCEIVVFESATVLEKPQFDGFADKVILVDAPIMLRLERASGRDGADKEKIWSRMENQKLMNALSEGASDPRIDAVIVNDGTLEKLEERTEKVMSDLFGDWRRI